MYREYLQSDNIAVLEVTVQGIRSMLNAKVLVDELLTVEMVQIVAGKYEYMYVYLYMYTHAYICKHIHKLVNTTDSYSFVHHYTYTHTGHLRTYEGNPYICRSCCEIITIVSYELIAQTILSSPEILTILYHIGE